MKKTSSANKPGDSTSETNPTTSISSEKTRWAEAPKLIAKGFLMGSADIVPGVSGGTMALITGIYERLIDAIKSVNTDLIGHLLRFRIQSIFSILHWKFLLLLFTGIGSAIVFFTRIVPLQVYMFTHPEIVYGLFFGLIVGSIVLLVQDAAPQKWKPVHVVPLLLGAAIGFWIVTLVPTETSESPAFVFFSGAIAICAMILPGISGSYLLLILNKYDYILQQLGNLGSVETVEAMLNLTPFALGALTGLALFTRLISWLLQRNYTTTMLVLIGFLVGSLYVIWPFQEREFKETVRETQVLPYSDPIVQALLAEDPSAIDQATDLTNDQATDQTTDLSTSQSTGQPTHQTTDQATNQTTPSTPEYQRISRFVNPNASFDELKIFEIETVSRKLITSNPQPPYPSQLGDKFWDGILGMGAGLGLIFFIAFLRRNV